METALNFNHILLFKTNISSHKGKQLLHTILDKHPAVQCWSIDMEDSDHVLRIISETLSHNDTKINKYSFIYDDVLFM